MLSDSGGNLHPRPGAKGPINSEGVEWGRNAEHAPLRDSGFRRCQQCGFPCHEDRDTSAPRGSQAGDGNSTVVQSGQDDVVTSAGCPLCGSYLWR